MHIHISMSVNIHTYMHTYTNLNKKCFEKNVFIEVYFRCGVSTTKPGLLLTAKKKKNNKTNKNKTKISRIISI